MQHQPVIQRFRALIFALLALTLVGCSSADLSRAATLVSQAATAVVTRTPVSIASTVAPAKQPITPTIRAAAPGATALIPTGTSEPTPANNARPTAKPTATAPPSATPLPRTLEGFRVVTPASLPREARQTLALIDSNGPFPYRQDGVVFQNRERLLPRKASNYYHEYTVITPGSPDRGARRIIVGDKDEFYYTDDHYNSFVRVIR